jgi:glycosyltransferase 2 family protein
VLIAAILALCAWALAGQWSDVREQLRTTSLAVLAGAGALAMAAMATFATGWRIILKDLGAPLGVRDAGGIYFLGQLGKYIPGSVWPVVAQTALAREHGVARRAVAAGFVLHLVVTLVTGGVVAALTMPFAGADALARYWWLFAALPAAVIALHPRLLGPGLRFVARLARRPEALIGAPSVRTLLHAGIWCAAGWVVFGLHVAMLGASVGGEGPDLLLRSIGGWALAWSVGFLVVVAPAGLGVREAALALVLGPALPPGGAAAVALLSRLVMTAADLLWGLLASWQVLRLRRRTERGSTPNA